MLRDFLLFVLFPSLLLAAAVFWLPMEVRDRYVLKKFAFLFFMSFLLEVALVLIVRFGDKELGSMFSDDEGLVGGFRLFLYRAPARVLEVIPAAGILAAFFTIGSLTRSNELTALKSLGVNLFRVFLPILLFTTACCVLTLSFTDRTVAPATLQVRKLDPRATYAADREIIFRERDGGLCFIQSLDLPRQLAYHLTFYDFQGQELDSETYAAFASWEEGVWHLRDGWTRKYRGERVADFEAFRHKDRILDDDPEILVQTAYDPAEMTFAQLGRVITFKKNAGLPPHAETVRFQHNIANSFALLVGVLLSLPLSMTFGRFAIAIGFPATMFISFLYWGLAIAIFEAMGENGRLSPELAPWIANVLFTGVGLFLLRGIRR